jgi:hypothetical protein
MLEGILVTLMTMLGKMVLAYFDQKQAKSSADNEAVSNAASQTAQDTSEIADAQATNNAVDRGTAADVAARLREHLAKQGGSGLGS